MDNKFKKDFEEILNRALDDKFEENFTRLFNEGFEKVVLPVLDDMREEIVSLKGEVAGLNGEVGGLKEDMAKLKAGQDRMERKMDHVIAKDPDQNDLLASHNKRIKKLEKHPAVA